MTKKKPWKNLEIKKLNKIPYDMEFTWYFQYHDSDGIRWEYYGTSFFFNFGSEIYAPWHVSTRNFKKYKTKIPR